MSSQREMIKYTPRHKNSYAPRILFGIRNFYAWLMEWDKLTRNYYLYSSRKSLERERAEDKIMQGERRKRFQTKRNRKTLIIPKKKGVK